MRYAGTTVVEHGGACQQWEAAASRAPYATPSRLSVCRCRAAPRFGHAGALRPRRALPKGVYAGRYHARSRWLPGHVCQFLRSAPLGGPGYVMSLHIIFITHLVIIITSNVFHYYIDSD